jgi:hypothetical protein
LKQFTVILFLLPLLFNLCGYRLLIDYLQQQHNEKLTAQLDKEDYADEDLISIKTALSMPYYTATMDFERVDGSIRIDGVEYNYVKRRIINDSLELLCLPNTVKQKLQTAKSDFFKISNDVQQPDNKKNSNSAKPASPESCQALLSYHLSSLCSEKQKYPVSITPFTPSLLAAVQEQPPEAVQA